MTVRVNTSEVTELIGDLRNIFPFDIRAGKRSALIAQDRIKTRTLSGKDVDGNFFSPYSESYKAFREERGRRTDIVDLFFSGTMFAAMTNRVSKDRITLFFRDNESDSKAFTHMEGAKKRRFFDVNADDVNLMIDELIKPFDDLR